MATSNKVLDVSFNGFDGVNIPNAHNGKASITNVTNFRINDNGSLEKRSGFTPIYTDPEYEIKTVWSSNVGGILKTYVVRGPFIYELDLNKKSASYCGSLSTSGSVPYFFHYKDSVYAIDSSNLYKIDSSVSVVYGYVPLYGKNWGTTRPGEVYQPLNLLHRVARISYVIQASAYTSMLPTKHPVSRIISVYKNGVKLSSDKYYFDVDYNTINIRDGVTPGESYLATVEYDSLSSPAYESFKSSSYAAVVGEAKSSRIFLWGSNIKNRMFISSQVSDEDLELAEQSVKGCGDIYFSEDNSFSVGDGQSCITAIAQHYDRILLFTDKNVWMTSALVNDGELPLMSINSTAGCSISSCISMAGNDPITIGKNSILRWTSDTDEHNECNAESISDPINPVLKRSFFQSGMSFYDKYRREILFYDPKDKGWVWIYSINKNRWFMFSSVSANGFFDADQTIGFYDGKTVYVFEEGKNEDQIYGSSPSTVTAVFESGILDFDSSNSKRLCDIEIKCDPKGNAIKTDILCNTGENVSFTTVASSEHSILKQRLNSSRFKYAILSVTAVGNCGQTIHSIKLTAKEKITH